MKPNPDLFEEFTELNRRLIEISHRFVLLEARLRPQVPQTNETQGIPARPEASLREGPDYRYGLPSADEWKALDKERQEDWINPRNV